MRGHKLTSTSILTFLMLSSHGKVISLSFYEIRAFADTNDCGIEKVT